ncbi:MAG: isomerizing glutamine--fructose-6-phosphate transaminase [Anaerovoracaceae bacterium]|jgi:glucosamine--fructose-6-phosphate aminotransferase (isomerizing)
MSDKNGYEFFMEKEMMEQPEVLRETLNTRVKDGLPDFSGEEIPDSFFAGVDRICIIGCGTAMHAGLVCRELMQKFAKVKTDVEIASEFPASFPLLDEKSLVIAISQSGETTDTLEALEFAKAFGVKSLGVLNVKDSTIGSKCDHVILTNAGPEKSVASTKAYTAQLAVAYLLAAKMAQVKELFSPEETRSFIAELLKTPEGVAEILTRREGIQDAADSILEAKDLFMIGRGLDHLVLREGTLKLKETSYIHAEAYPSGEIKHGTVALLTDGTPVISLVTQDAVKERSFRNIAEMAEKVPNVIVFVTEKLLAEAKEKIGKDACRYVTIPTYSDIYMPIVAVIALQLMAFYVSRDKGLDVDSPRNLTKVVMG